MAYGYVPVDRDQSFLLPPDVRAWLPAGHLVWFVIDVVDEVDTSRLHARYRRGGVGRRAYHPEMLLALLIYAYCCGQRSSRQIERLCEVDVAYRVICAHHVPDHTTIARFRQAFADEVVGLFADVLELCAAAGMVKVGVVAVDGTKFAADASLRANRTRARVEAEIRVMLTEAEQIDAAEDDEFGGRRGDELPDEMVDRRSRLVRLRAARDELERRHKARQAEGDRVRVAYRQRQREGRERGGHRGGRVPTVLDPVEEAQANLDWERQRLADRQADYEARCEALGRRPRGAAPTTGGRRLRRAEARLATAQQRAAVATVSTKRSRRGKDDNNDTVNITDIDSGIMPTQGGGWAQGYNAQAAVSEDGIVVAADVTHDINDSGWCEPMSNATRSNLDNAGITEPVGTELFDAGYWSNSNGANVTDGIDGGPPSRLIATTKSYKQRQALREKGPASGPPPPGATPAEAMEHRLRSADGEALYKKRQHIVEPVFGAIKHDRGFRRFTQRGLDAVRAEWRLITATHNLMKLYRTIN
jgi:transposase